MVGIKGGGERQISVTLRRRSATNPRRDWALVVLVFITMVLLVLALAPVGVLLTLVLVLAL